jgi:DNA-binding response OmpR family regulator
LSPFYRDERIYVDLRQQLVMLDGETVRSTLLQYRLLAVLVEHAGEVR